MHKRGSLMRARKAIYLFSTLVLALFLSVGLVTTRALAEEAFRDTGG